jgi:hypothetical protein
MRTVNEYSNSAEECRKLAKLMARPDDRKALEQMALTWEKLAKDRELDLQTDDVWSEIGGEIADQKRGASDCGEYCKVAGFAQSHDA